MFVFYLTACLSFLCYVIVQLEFNQMAGIKRYILYNKLFVFVVGEEESYVAIFPPHNSLKISIKWLLQYIVLIPLGVITQN